MRVKVSFPILLKSEGDHWITIHPHGKGAVGKYGDKDYRRIKIDSSGNIVGGSVPKELYGKPIHDAFRKQGKPHPHLSKHLNDIGVEHTMELKDNGHHEYVIGSGVKSDKDVHGRPTAQRGTVKFEIPNARSKFQSDEWAHVYSNFGDKDKLKAMGARFDGDTKTWNIPLQDIPNVAKHFKHATISHRVAEKFEKLHGNNEKYSLSEKEIKEKEKREAELREQENAKREAAIKKKEEEDNLQKQKELEEYKGMSSREIKDAVQSKWPKWKRDLQRMRGHLVYDSFGTGYTMRGKLSREDFLNARKHNEIFESDSYGWLIRPHQYPSAFYDAVKKENEEKENKQVALKEFQRRFRSESTYPRSEDGKQIPMPKGETFVVRPMNVYGGGEEFIIDKEGGKIWFVENNGSDGGDWSQNNIRTGGAGAIGRYIPYTEEKADQIKKLFEEGESGVKKSLRTKSEWRQVNRTKRDEYGTHETFADTKHDSYPLTKGGKPSRERTLAAWRYINTCHDGDEYSQEERKRIKSKIRKFAKDHFGLDLKDGGIEKSLCVVFQIR